jgi:hypothetical protein
MHNNAPMFPSAIEAILLYKVCQVDLCAYLFAF